MRSIAQAGAHAQALASLGLLLQPVGLVDQLLCLRSIPPGLVPRGEGTESVGLTHGLLGLAEQGERLVQPLLGSGCLSTLLEDPAQPDQCAGKIRLLADLAPALERAVTSGRPYVLDVIIDRDKGVPLTGSWAMPPVPIGKPVFGEPK